MLFALGYAGFVGLKLLYLCNINIAWHWYKNFMGFAIHLHKDTNIRDMAFVGLITYLHKTKT